MIAVTGATGHLGQLAIQELIKRGVSPSSIIAAVRSPAKAEGLKKIGVSVREADYERPETLRSALRGVDQLLLISSSEIGKRESQHKNAIAAAKEAGVSLIAYTSILRADTSVLGLAKEHWATEKAIKESGLKYIFLRNGWYLENHTENLGSALEHGVLLGAAGDGRFASASRLDFAEAAATVLTSKGHDNKTYELAGDTSFTLTELAQAVSQASGKKIAYNNMSEADYEKTLVSFGLPQEFAHLLADSDTGASKGDLDSKSKDLATLIGRKTTTLKDAVAKALR